MRILVARKWRMLGMAVIILLLLTTFQRFWGIFYLTPNAVTRDYLAASNLSASAVLKEERFHFHGKTYACFVLGYADGAELLVTKRSWHGWCRITVDGGSYSCRNESVQCWRLHELKNKKNSILYGFLMEGVGQDGAILFSREVLLL